MHKLNPGVRTLTINAVFACVADLDATGNKQIIVGIQTSTGYKVTVINHDGTIRTRPIASISPSSLTFNNQNVGTTSGSQPVSVSNTGNSPLSISSISASGDFAQTNTCGNSVNAGANCTVNVIFTPMAAGTRSGALTITDNNNGIVNSAQTVNLTGTGSDFSLSAASTLATVTAGQSATYSVNINPLGGFIQALTLICTGAPSLSSCAVSPSSVTLNGSGASTATVTATTTASTMVAPQRVEPPISWLGLRDLIPIIMWFLVLATTMAVMGRRRWARLILTASILLIVIWTACGGGGGSSVVHNPGTPAGTYTLTITENSSSGSATLSHTQNLTLTVN